MEGNFIPFFPKAENTGTFTPSTGKGNGAASTPGGLRLVNQKAAVEGIGQTDLSHKPLVTLQREGDRVTIIRIQCACGQVIDLECVY